MDALTTSLSLLRAFVPPDLSLHYLIALIGPVAESIGMTAAAMLLAYLISLPLGLYIGSRAPGGGALQAVLSGIRAIPDLTLAIFCVIFVGVGPAAGMIAMAIFYTAAVAKIFGDQLYEAQQLFFYQRMVAYLLITWIIVLAVDRASAWTRRRIGGMEHAPEEAFA